ncbi:MAG: fibronectin type III domain-containing protein [Fibrobacterota bacterium]
MSKILILLPALCFCLSIVQGPQVGNNRENSFTVGWQTDSLSDSKLKWGLSPASLTDSIESGEQRTWHVLMAESLMPDTKYYYQVSSNTAASPVYFTKTAISKDTPFRFGLITDTHGGYLFRLSWEKTRGNCQVLLKDSANLWFNLGDVVAYDGCPDLDSMFRKTLIYKTRMDSVEHYVPIYEILGNHDLAPILPGPIWANTDSSVYSFILPEDNIYTGTPKGYFYSFDYGVIHFQVLRYHTYSADDSAVMNWMAADFDSAKARGQLHNIVLCHWGIFDFGGSLSTNLAWWNWKSTYYKNQRSHFYHVLDTHDVELYLHGHCHYYSRTKICSQTCADFDTVWNHENFKNSIWDITAGRFGEGAGKSSDSSKWEMARFFNSCCDTVYYMQLNVDFRQIMTRAIAVIYTGATTYNNTVIDSFKLRPDAPGNLNALVAGNEVSLTWNKVENGIALNGVGGYNIYRSDVSYESVRNTTQSQYVKIGSVASPDSVNFIDTDPRLSEGAKYYVVCAYDTNYGKREGNYSNEVTSNGTGINNQAQLRRMQWEIGPNPFQAATTVTVRRLPEKQPVALAIFDIDGRQVRYFYSTPGTGGTAHFHWDGRDLHGNTAATGIYLARLTVGSNISCKLLLLTR